MAQNEDVCFIYYMVTLTGDLFFRIYQNIPDSKQLHQHRLKKKKPFSHYSLLPSDISFLTIFPLYYSLWSCKVFFLNYEHHHISPKFFNIQEQKAIFLYNIDATITPSKFNTKSFIILNPQAIFKICPIVSLPVSFTAGLFKSEKKLSVYICEMKVEKYYNCEI